MPETLRDRLAEAIWRTSRADEGTISATGANHIADALLPLVEQHVAERERDAFMDGYERAMDSLSAAEATLREVRALADGWDCEWGEGRECDGPTCCRRDDLRRILDREGGDRG